MAGLRWIKAAAQDAPAGTWTGSCQNESVVVLKFSRVLFRPIYFGLSGPWGRQLHAVACVLLLTAVSWALLSPDPFAQVQETPLSWLQRLDDLLLHTLAFLSLSSVLLSFTVRLQQNVSSSAVGGLLAYAVVTELLQTVVPGRMCDATDALANLTGVVAGLLLVLASLSVSRTAVARRCDKPKSAGRVATT